MIGYTLRLHSRSVTSVLSSENIATICRHAFYAFVSVKSTNNRLLQLRKKNSCPWQCSRCLERLSSSMRTPTSVHRTRKRVDALHSETRQFITADVYRVQTNDLEFSNTWWLLCLGRDVLGIAADLLQRPVETWIELQHHRWGDLTMIHARAKRSRTRWFTQKYFSTSL